MSILTEIFNPTNIYLQPWHENIIGAAYKGDIMIGNLKDSINSVDVPFTSVVGHSINKIYFLILYHQNLKWVSQYVGINPIGSDLSICHLLRFSKKGVKLIEELTDKQFTYTVTLSQWALAVRQRLQIEIQKIKEEIKNNDTRINSSISQRGVFDFSPGF